MSSRGKNCVATPPLASAFRALVLIFLVAGVFNASVATAASIRRMTLTQVRDAAGVIVKGDVVSSSERSIRGLPVRQYTLQVREVLRGHAAKKVLVSGLAEILPELQEGKSYILFLSSKNKTATVGGPQGVFSIEEAIVGGSRKPILLSGDGESLIVRENGIVRGPKVEISEGKLVAAAGSGWHTDARETGAIAENADGSRAPRARPSDVANDAAARYATLDDLRNFINGNKASN